MTTSQGARNDTGGRLAMTNKHGRRLNPGNTKLIIGLPYIELSVYNPAKPIGKNVTTKLK